MILPTTGFWNVSGGVQPVLPTNGLVMYLNGKNPASIINDPVSNWYDETTYDNDFKQDTPSRRPSKGTTSFGGVYFGTGNKSMDGKNSYLAERNYLTSSTWFLTFISPDVNTVQIIYSIDTTNFSFIPLFYIASGNIRFLLRDHDAAAYFIDVPISINTKYLVTGRWDGTNMYLYVNGALKGTTPAAFNDLGAFVFERIGTRSNAYSNFYKGTIGSLLWYDNDLNIATQQQAENYLINEYEI